MVLKENWRRACLAINSSLAELALRWVQTIGRGEHSWAVEGWDVEDGLKNVLDEPV